LRNVPLMVRIIIEIDDARRYFFAHHKDPGSLNPNI
jgi:hypothetical protein